MGYSIYVACPDKATMEEMYEFLLKNYQPCTLRTDGLRYHSEGRGREDLGGLDYVLDGVEFPVGFDYNCMSGPERIFMFAVVKWMAWVLLPAKPEYHYDTEEVFPVEESPINVEYLRSQLKNDPIVEGKIIAPFVEEMYRKLQSLDAAWKELKEKGGE